MFHTHNIQIIGQMDYQIDNQVATESALFTEENFGLGRIPFHQRDIL